MVGILMLFEAPFGNGVRSRIYRFNQTKTLSTLKLVSGQASIWISVFSSKYHSEQCFCDAKKISFCDLKSSISYVFSFQIALC